VQWTTALLTQGIRDSTIPVQIIGFYNGICKRWNPLLIIIVVWAALTLPLVFLRGFNSDEGLAVNIARSALEDGNWLTPHVFNVRWVERPTLLSWVVAAVSFPVGHVSQMSARLPIILFLLLGCLLIYSLLRGMKTSIPAALLGTAVFLACPIVIQSYVMVTADMPLAVLLFLAFFVWWNGCENGSVSFSRWIAIGVVLAFAALLKGPQPIAYFALGIGLFILGSRSWSQIPGFLLAGTVCLLPVAAWYWSIYLPGDIVTWAAFMRVRPVILFNGPIKGSLKLLAEILPAIVLATASLVSCGLRNKRNFPPAFVGALACYAFTTSAIVLFWPGGFAPRYLFPMFLPLAVLGGLGYDSLSARGPKVAATILVLSASLLSYAFVYSVIAAPLMPRAFRRTQIEAAEMVKLVEGAPGPIYRTGFAALNVLPYVPGRIITVTLRELETIHGPAWIVLPDDDAQSLLTQRASEVRLVMPPGHSEEWRLLHLEK
jgi:4-amino-4-deoxy-L-arabinose transferase-like glycosyltransferase